MNEDINPAQLEKIRQLLAVAEDPATSPEAAENYSARAMALLAKYGIDAALLHDSGQDRDKVEGRLYTLPAPYALDKLQLQGGIAEALGCRAIDISDRASGANKRLHLFGFTADLDRAEMLYRSLVLQQAHALVYAPGPRHHESPAAYKRSFFAAFASTVVGRLKAAEAKAKQEAPDVGGKSTDLVLADRHREVEAMFTDHYPNTRRTKRRLSGSGGRHGAEAGQRADLGGGNRVDGGRRAIGA